MGLCIAALMIPIEHIETKTSLYSFSVCYAYLSLIFRSEKSIVIGSYAYAFRKILMKSLRVLPLVLILFFGFFFAFRVRSRFITNEGQEHHYLENSAIDGYLSEGLVKLSLMFLGNIYQ
jgi:hypothetical protein